MTGIIALYIFMLAAGNVVGGYVSTERMLEMFKTSQDKRKGGQA